MGKNGKKNKSKKQQQEKIDVAKPDDKSVKGINETSKDIKVYGYSLVIGSKNLLVDTNLTIAHGRKYGLIGINGSGKSSLLNKLYSREIPYPKGIDTYMVEQEIEVSDTQNVFEMVLNSNTKRINCKEMIDKLDEKLDDDLTDDETVEIMGQIEKLENDWSSNEWDRDPSIVQKILSGLGFTHGDQKKPTSQFSGGWRMRISLARALYLKPTLLLLDEPTNHLDLDAVIWLTEYLSKEWKNTLVVVSHNIDFIDTVCTDIIHLYKQKLDYYKGGYYSFKAMLAQKEKAKQKEWDKVMGQINKMKSKSTPKKEVQEFLKKKEAEGIVKPDKPYTVRIHFEELSKVTQKLVNLDNVTFGYSDDKILFKDVSLGIDMDTRMVIIGANGVGKTTLMKLMSGEIDIGTVDGVLPIKTYPKMRLGYFHQHSKDHLPEDKTPIEFLEEVASKYRIDEDPVQIVRKHLGMIGLDGKMHKQKMGSFSGGQKARVVMVQMQIMAPHLLFLDEPTNHLDIETIEALIDAINRFDGGVVMITHDATLIHGLEDVQTYEVKDKGVYKIDYDDYVEKIIEEKEEDEESFTEYNLRKTQKKKDNEVKIETK